MIAWEASHDWGDAVQLARFSVDIIEEYKSLIATLYDLLGVEREAGKPHHRRNPSRAREGASPPRLSA